ncbi:MAG: hypothetical protein WCV84_00910 [Patescibacteria group bacterium]
MNERLKKILIILGFVAIAIGMGFVIYFVFFKPAALPTPTPPEETPTGVLPSAGLGAPQAGVTPGAGGLPTAGEVPSEVGVTPGAGVAPSAPRTVVLTEGFAQAVSLTAQKDGVRMYNPQDGRFYKIMPDGTSVALSNEIFYNVDNVTWANQSDKAVIEYPDGAKTMYDFKKDKQYTLPKYWEDFSFAPQDEQIAAKSIGNNETNRFLVVANPDGTEARPVQELGNNQDKVDVSWSPNNQVVAFARTGSAMGVDRQQILLVGQNQENFPGLIVEGQGFVPSWSPTGKNLLYSVYTTDNGYLPELWVSGASGSNINANRRRINLQTWADKCVWYSESVIYCAVPNGLSSGAALQRELFSNLPDSLVKIDLQSGQKVDLGQPDGSPSLQQMSVSGDGKYLFYTDRGSGRLNRFTLAP